MQVAATKVAPESVQTFIQEYFDAWKGTDEDRILAYYSDDVVIHFPTTELGPHRQSGRGGMEF